MRLRAKDLPADGSSKLVLVDGVLFEVKRSRQLMDGRKSIYYARQVSMVGPAGPDVGWWTRYGWGLMVRDLKLMAKRQDEA